MATFPATLTPSVQVSWNGSGLFDQPHDDVTGDVMSDPGVAIDLGKDGARALDPPKVGACDFSLFNHTGKYSQERPDSPVYQLVIPGRPVRVMGQHGVTDAYDAPTLYTEDDYYDGSATFTLARTRIDDISQSTGWGQQTVSITTLGVESLFVGHAVTIPVMVGPRVDQCITAVLDAVGWPSDKRAVSTADTTLTYWWCDEREPWAALLELLQSEGPGALYVDADSVFHFENRNYRVTTPRSTTPQAAYFDQGLSLSDEYDAATLYTEDDTYDGGTSGLYFTALSYDPGFKTIRNRATYTIRTRQLASLAAVWTYGANLALGAGQSITLIARPSDPFQNAVVPVAGTDYTVAGGTISASLSASSGLVAFLTLTATSGAPTVSALQIRAQSLAVVGETTVQNAVDASSSIAKFSPIPGQNIPIVLDVGGWAEITAGQAVGVCDAWVARYMVQRPSVTIELRNADGNHLREILQRNISDRVTLYEANTGLQAADVWVNAKHLTLRAPCASDIVCTLGCEKVDEVSGFVWDGAGTRWDSATWGL
jgi:hypothetical protein